MSRAATFEQKQQGHEVFDALLSGIFGTGIANDNRIRSSLYRLWAAVLADEIGVEGIINPSKGDNHFSRISAKNANKVHGLFEFLFQIPEVRGELSKIPKLLQDWESKLKEVVLSETREPKAILDYLKQDTLIQKVRSYIKNNYNEEVVSDLGKSAAVAADSSSSSSSSSSIAKKGKASEVQDYFIEGLMTEVDGDKEKAAKIYEQGLALAGDKDKLYTSQILLHLGYCSSDPVKTFNHFEEARKLGNAEALMMVGYCYFMGRGVEKDGITAFNKFKEAMQLGDVNAIYIVGVHYYIGAGVAEDKIKGLEFLKKAANLGAVEAQYTLSRLSLAQGNSKEELRWLELAAAQKFPAALNSLAIRYRDGDGVKVDIGKMTKLFNEAIDLGNKEAKVNLSVHYLQKFDETQDHKYATEAVKLLEDSVEDSLFMALFTKAIRCAKGVGVEVDIIVSLMLFRDITKMDGTKEYRTKEGENIIKYIVDQVPKLIGKAELEANASLVGASSSSSSSQTTASPSSSSSNSSAEAVIAANNKKTLTALSKLSESDETGKYQETIKSKLTAFTDLAGLSGEEKEKLATLKGKYGVEQGTKGQGR